MPQTSTPYDDVFRTMLVDCIRLILPVINEAFGESYTGSERIEFLQNEHFLNRQDGDEKKRVTDSCFVVIYTSAAGVIVSKTYHMESQATPDGSLIWRIFEYDAQIALDGGNVEDNVLTVTFPHSAVLMLRSTRATPDSMTIRIVTPGGEASYEIPVIKVQSYGIEEIFAKRLYFLIPFYIFTHEKDFAKYETDGEKLETLREEYAGISDRLEKLTEAGELDEYTKCAITDMSKKVLDHIAKNYERVREGVREIMGGRVLNYEAKDIRNAALAEGRNEGRDITLTESIRSLMQKLKMTAQEAMDALGIPDEQRARYLSAIS